MKYGELPTQIGIFEVDCRQMMFYQDMPIKLLLQSNVVFETRLECFTTIIRKACNDFINAFTFDKFFNSYVYVSAKHLFQAKGCPFNRPGYHADGFMSDDINYIWSNCAPTVFNYSPFSLSMDDALSIKEMEEQAKEEFEATYPVNSLLRLNQFNIHKVATDIQPGLRTFLKVSFSKDRYNLVGNAHNYELAYNWEMKDRSATRNIPQGKIKNYLK